jgi:protein gp37
MENSKIEWCDHTFNPWVGCSRVSPGCEHCYAEAQDKRFGKDRWGKGKLRSRTSNGNWDHVLSWNRGAERNMFRQCDVCGHREFRKWDSSLPPGGLSCCSNKECVSLPETDSFPVRPRVFCASMGDWLDDEVPIEWLADLLELITATPMLDWLLLTKRPENWKKRIQNAKMLGGSISQAIGLWELDVPPVNVWVGTTVEDQQRADERIPALLQIPARVRFLSCEPLLGTVDLYDTDWVDCMGHPNIQWVICGGESGPHARLMHPEWVRDIRDQCRTAKVPFFFKQWGGPRKHVAGAELDGETFRKFPGICCGSNDKGERHGSATPSAPAQPTG